MDQVTRLKLNYNPKITSNNSWMHFHQLFIVHIIKFWIALSSVLHPCQHSIGYMGLGDGFYRSKDPTNSIKVLNEKSTCTKEKPENINNKIHIHIYN